MPAPRMKCPACGAAVRATHRFCPSCGAPQGAAAAAPAPPPPPPPGSSGASLQVAGVQAHHLEEERRLVSVLFADLSGSTALGDHLDPEDLRTILTSFFSAVSRQIARHGGTIDKYIGDAVMAVFGAPVAHDDDAERAVHAALAMQGAVADLNDRLEREHGVRLGLRIGINTGEVVGGILGGDAQAAYTVVGDTVNTAQRLESAAPPGQILVGETTYRLARATFEFEQLEPLTLKGKSEPIPAHHVLGQAERHWDPDAPAFVGRGQQLESLASYALEARQGGGHAVHLHGEPGVGKSRLLEEFVARLPAATDLLQAGCVSYEAGNAYALVNNFLRAAFRIHAGDDEASARTSVGAALEQVSLPADSTAVELLVEVLGYGVRSALDPETKRRLIVSLLVRYLRGRSEAGTLVVLIEDVHWIDAASAAAFAEVASGVGEMRCLLLSTSREPNSHWRAAEVALAPLDPAEAEELLDRAAAAPLSPKVRAVVLERTGGNPFFIAEVVRSLSTETSARVPPTVQEVLAARVDGLVAGAKKLAQRASVIGREFAIRLLAEISEGEPLQSSLTALEVAALIAEVGVVPERIYGFRHALVQEVIYHGILLATRRRLHGRIGGVIEHVYAGRLEERVELLAYHYSRSDHDQQALKWLVKAAERARGLYANEEALNHYRDALSRSADGHGPLDAGTLHERIADVLILTGRYDDAIAGLEQARGRLAEPSPARLARLHRKSAAALRVKGEYPQALEALAEARAALGGEPHVEAARLGVEEGALHWRRGDYDGARTTLAKAVEVGTELGADQVVAEGLMQLGNVCFATGLDEAVGFYRRARELYERLGNLHGVTTARTNLGGAYVRMGRWEDGLIEMRESLATAERIGNPWSIGRCHNNIGEVDLMRGALEPAIEAFGRAIEIWEPIGYANGVAIALIGLGAARAQTGDVEQGRADLLSARDRFALLGSSTYLPELYRHLASAELAARRLDEAEEAAELSLDYSRSAGARHLEALARRVLGEIALARGDREAARELFQACRDEQAELGELAELSRTEELLARV